MADKPTWILCRRNDVPGTAAYGRKESHIGKCIRNTGMRNPEKAETFYALELPPIAKPKG